MLTIRLNRCGKKNKPYFRFVLQEHTIAPGGKHVEILGSYDPHSKKTVLETERIKYWISEGVQISDTAYNLFLKNEIIKGEKRKVKLPAKKVEAVKEEEKKTEIPAETKAEVPVEERAAEKQVEKPEAIEVEAPQAAELTTEKK
jgi:small subunit ribosomal protein S16